MIAASSTYKVYVIQNQQGRFYIGLSEEVLRRLEEHNTGISKWTRGKGPWSLSWTSEAICLTNSHSQDFNI